MSEEKTIYLTPDENNVWHEAEIIEVDMNNIGEALTKAYIQGREKAVEEFVEFVRNDWKITQACVVTDEKTDCFRIGSFLVNLLEQFKDEYKEQLKEPKNEDINQEEAR